MPETPRTRLVIPKAQRSIIYYPDDVDRIVQVCEAHGYEIDRDTAQWAWQEQSACYAAGWLDLPQDDEWLLTIIRQHLDEVQE